MKHPEYKFKKLNYLYEVLEIFSAGIVLFGWEAKSLSSFNGDINGAYCKFIDNNLKLINSKITPLQTTNLVNETIDDRDRQLLLNKSQLTKIKKQLEIGHCTCVPVKLYRNEKHLWKLDIAVVKGRNTVDKRQYIKEKDIKREINL